MAVRRTDGEGGGTLDFAVGKRLRGCRYLCQSLRHRRWRRHLPLHKGGVGFSNFSIGFVGAACPQAAAVHRNISVCCAAGCTPRAFVTLRSTAGLPALQILSPAPCAVVGAGACRRCERVARGSPLGGQPAEAGRRPPRGLPLGVNAAPYKFY